MKRRNSYLGCTEKYDSTIHGKLVDWTNGYYSIDESGQAWSFKANKPKKLKSYITSNGYPHYSFMVGGKRIVATVHSLVAEAFIGPRSKGTQVRHLDGIKLNAKLENLAYGTCEENHQDMLRHGRKKQKLYKEEAVEILNLLEEGGMTQTEIAKRFNVSPATVTWIKLGLSWPGLRE